VSLTLEVTGQKQGKDTATNLVVYCTVQAKYAINYGNTIIVDLEIMYFSFVNSVAFSASKTTKETLVSCLIKY
jgi:hypothetical protein